MNFKKQERSLLLPLLFLAIACSNDPYSKTPVVERPEVQINSIDEDGILSSSEAASVIVSGTTTIEDRYTVGVTISDGQKSVFGDAVVKNNKWTTPSLTLKDLKDGTITVSAEGTSQAGTLSRTVKISLLLDKTPPQIKLSGPIGTDGLINSSLAKSIFFKGTTNAAHGQEVQVLLLDGNAAQVSHWASVKDGQWSTAEADISGLENGPIQIMAEVTDIAGNRAVSSPASFILDKTR